MEYVKDNPKKFSAVELAGAAGILNSLDLLADTAGKGKSGFAESLTALFDIHIIAAKLGLINKNLDADPYGMFRTDGDIRKISKDEIFLGGIEGRNTHSIAKWISINEKGRLSDEDRSVIVSQYARHLCSNFGTIGRELVRHRTLARQEMNEYHDKSILARLFTRRQYPTCVFPERFDPKTASSEGYKKMAARVFAEKVGTMVPKLRLPESVIDERLPYLANNPFIEVIGAVTDNLARDLAMEIQVGGDRFDHKDIREWLYGISKDNLQLFRNQVEVYASKMHPDGDHQDNKDFVRKQLDGWLAGVVTKEDQIAHNEETKDLENEYRTIQKAYAIAEPTDRLVSGRLAEDFSRPVVWSRELPLILPEHPEILGVAFMDYKDCTNVHVLTDNGECHLVEVQPRDTVLAVAKECERLLEERMGNKVDNHSVDFIEQLESGAKTAAIPESAGIISESIENFFSKLSLEDLVLAFSFYRPDGEGPDQAAPGFIDNDKDRELVQGALKTYLNVPIGAPEVEEDLIRKSSRDMFLNTLYSLSPETVKKMEAELSDAGLGKNDDKKAETMEDTKQRLREDIDFECRQVLRLLFERDGGVGVMKAPSFAPPQDLDGNIFQGFNAARLTAQLAAYGPATSVFVSEKDIAALGATVSPGEKNRFCTLEDGTHVWNLSQTSYRRQHPEHFRAISAACSEPSMGDETFKAMRLFEADNLGLGDKAGITESDRQLKMKGFLHDYHNELSGTVNEAWKKSTIADGVASLSLVSKMRYEPGVGELPDKKMQFAEIDEVYSFRKGALMYPAYETMMEAGKRVSAVESAFPAFKERQGIDVNAIIKHVNADIRIRNERHQAESETKSNGVHI